MWRRVDLVKWTDVPEERIASIFREEISANEEPAWAGSSRIFLPGTVVFYPIIFVFGFVLQRHGCCVYWNGIDQPIARQQLCKHGPTRNNRRGCVSMSSAPRPVLLTDQWIRSLTRDTCFLCVVRAERIWDNTGMRIDCTWVPSSKGTAVWPEEELEDFVWRHLRYSAVVLWVCNLVRLL
jgi:hypothetical protein